MQPGEGELKIDELKKALGRLKESLALPKTDITRDSSIQRFEFTVELSWKALQRYLRSLGVRDVLAPKLVIREAARLKIIEDPESWIHFIDQRNLSSYTYKEALAEQVYSTAQRLPAFVDQLIARIESDV